MEARYWSLCPWGGEASLAEAAGAAGAPGGGWGEGGDQCQALRGIWVGAVAPPTTALPSSGWLWRRDVVCWLPGLGAGLARPAPAEGNQRPSVNTRPLHGAARNSGGKS